MLIGGLIVIGLWRLAGDRYLGLGVPTIVEAFEAPLGAEVFGWKLGFTLVTLAAGFLGGEVTPLFFVGAALASWMAGWLGLPVALAAAVGMAGLFGAAAQAPLALSVMAVELCGWHVLPHVVLVAVVARLLAFRRSIYTR
jgi:H+/Cl- antiporter ClcA